MEICKDSRAIVLLQNMGNPEKWQSPGTRSFRAQQAHVSGRWTVVRRICEVKGSEGKSIDIVASCTARELPSASYPAVFACTLNAALYPYPLNRNERSGAALLRSGSLVSFIMKARITRSHCATRKTRTVQVQETKYQVQPTRIVLHLSVLALCLPQRCYG